MDQRYEAEQGKPCKELQEAYSDVCQQTPKTDNQGYVKLTFLPHTEEHPYPETTLSELAAEVERLVAAGVRIQDIAILVRKNNKIPAVADYFDQNTAYRVVSDEAFYLEASLAVCMLIDGIRYLAQPEDRIAQARLAVNYQREVLHRETDLNTLLLDGVDNYLPAGFLLQTGELRLMPLYELMERLFDLFQLQELPAQDAYLCAFYDAVTAYLQDHCSELSGFLA